MATLTELDLYLAQGPEDARDDAEYGQLVKIYDALKYIAKNFANATASDPTLDALAAFNTNGFLVQTAPDTFVGRTLVGTASEIAVTNGAGTAGNPVFSLPPTLVLAGKTVFSLGFGSDTVAVPNDLSRHIALWGTLYGFSITSSQLNYNVGSGADHAFFVDGVEALRLDNAAAFFAGAVTVGNTTVINGDSIEINQLGAGNRFAYIDFHAAGSGTDFNARIIRHPGVNGNFELNNFGIGNVALSGGGAFQWNSNTIWHAGNDGAGSGLDADTVDGFAPFTARGALTIVLRDANGDIFVDDVYASRGNSTGVIYFGDQSSGSRYLFYDGSNYLLETDGGAALNIGSPSSSGSVNVSRDGAAKDPYGPIAVTRGTASHFSYFGLTRSGQIGWSIGVDTSNRITFGTGGGGAGGTITSTLLALNSSGDLTADRYVYADYFNQSSGENENGTVGQLAYLTNGDNFIRKASVAHVFQALGLFTASYATPGYLRLPRSGGANGLLFQWGQTSVAANTTTVINYPIAFSAAYTVVGSGAVEIGNVNAQDNPPGVSAIGTSNFSVWNSGDTSSTFYWLAIGI